MLIKLLFLFGVFANSSPQEVNFDNIRQMLRGDGLGGWVHGSVSDQSLFVFTWRHPENFFVNYQFPVVAKTAVRRQLAQVQRHDFVVIKGDFIENDAPLPHLEITEFVRIEEWQGEGAEESYNHSAQIPEELAGKKEVIVKVHAIANEGKVLVVEYKDRVIPVFNPMGELAARLYRNDKIRLKFVLRRRPDRPSHMMVAFHEDEPIKVLDSIREGHDSEITLSGPLVKFPKSPQIQFDIFALRDTTAGINRNYTLVNFSDISIFTKLLEKLGSTWEQYAEDSVYQRNKFINKRIIVTARGKKNVMDANQANPQILIDNIDDIDFEILD